MARAVVLLPAVLMLATPAPPAGAEVRRCVMPDNTTVYTDRRCPDIGAVERPAAAATPQLRTYRPACPRTLRDLAFEVSAAIEAQDANRLAGVYHWTGMSTRQGYAQMQRLQTIVDRQLVDLLPVYPGQSVDEYTYTPPSRPPVALRLEQVSANGSTPIRTILGLRRHMDCWWVTDGGTRRVPAPAPDPVPPDAVDDETGD